MRVVEFPRHKLRQLHQLRGVRAVVGLGRSQRSHWCTRACVPRVRARGRLVASAAGLELQTARLPLTSNRASLSERSRCRTGKNPGFPIIGYFLHSGCLRNKVHCHRNQSTPISSYVLMATPSARRMRNRQQCAPRVVIEINAVSAIWATCRHCQKTTANDPNSGNRKLIKNNEKHCNWNK